MKPIAIVSLIVLVGCTAMAAAAAPENRRSTFAIDYIVEISAREPKAAQVRWELSGAAEVIDLWLDLPADGRITNLRASGALHVDAHGARWILPGPFAHLSYTVQLDHRRGKQGRYDSFSAADWIVTRARDLFPRTSIRTRDGSAARSRAQLTFRLPAGWQVASALPRLDATRFTIEAGARILAKPRGWFILGSFHEARQEIAGIMVHLARAGAAGIEPPQLFGFLERVLPALQHLLGAAPQTVLIVQAPDPMWHGGISARGSLFLHAERPLRTPDHTSPYLHELFHVLQRFRFGTDADWLTEGLAEYYSLELQRRSALISAAQFNRALGLFVKYGQWGVDLTRQHDSAATNNSAPALLYALDQRIQRATAGKMRLDDVVRSLPVGATIDTATFERTVAQVAGKRFTRFFQRHVRGGVRPSMSSAQER